MAGKYLQDRERQEKISRVTGIVLTVAVHLCIAVFGVFTGLKYIYPPPEEKSILIDFSEDRPLKPRQVKTGTQPRAVNADPKKDIELVQSSEAQHQGTKLNEAPEATTGPDGDVEVPEPPREKEINRRALFHSADNTTVKDTLAAQTAEKVSDALKAGHAQGNTKTGKTSGEPNAKLAGRTVLGTLPKWKYGWTTTERSKRPSLEQKGLLSRTRRYGTRQGRRRWSRISIWMPPHLLCSQER